MSGISQSAGISANGGTSRARRSIGRITMAVLAAAVVYLAKDKIHLALVKATGTEMGRIPGGMPPRPWSPDPASNGHVGALSAN
jgi:hypothetical protein